MTEIEALHRMEQMEASRAEFLEWWIIEEDKLRREHLTTGPQAMIIAYRAWLKGRSAHRPQPP